MNNQDTASKVIEKLSRQIAGLVKDNTVLSVIIEEQQAEIKELQQKTNHADVEALMEKEEKKQ